MSFDFSLTTFSPKGKLLQIEYALKAVSQGKASLGICAKNGVVIATDKKINSSLIDEVNLNTFFPFCYGQKTIYRHVLTPLFIYLFSLLFFNSTNFISHDIDFDNDSIYTFYFIKPRSHCIKKFRSLIKLVGLYILVWDQISEYWYARHVNVHKPTTASTTKINQLVC